MRQLLLSTHASGELNLISLLGKQLRNYVISQLAELDPEYVCVCVCIRPHSVCAVSACACVCVRVRVCACVCVSVFVSVWVGRWEGVTNQTAV